MQYQFNNSTTIPLISNTGYGIAGVPSKSYDVYYFDSTASAKQSKFANVFADYQLAHQPSSSTFSNHHANDIVTSSSFEDRTIANHHDQSLTDHSYDANFGSSEHVGIEYSESVSNKSNSPNQTEEVRQADRATDGSNQNTETSDVSEESQAPSSPEDALSVEQEHAVEETVDGTAEQKWEFATQDIAKEDTSTHLIVANAAGSEKHVASEKQKAGISNPITLAPPMEHGKKSNSSDNSDLHHSKVVPKHRGTSHDSLQPVADDAIISKNSTTHSSPNNLTERISDTPEHQIGIVQTKKNSRNVQVSIGTSTDQTPAIHEGIRYSLIDGRTVKNVDPNLLFNELSTKDQPVVQKEFQRFLDDIGNDSIVRHARLVIKGDQHGELRLLIKPPELGVMRIKFSLHQNTVEGKFIVDNVLAKDVVERNLADIQRHLRDNGLESRGIEVSLQNNANNYSARSNRFDLNASHNSSYAHVTSTDVLDDGDNSSNVYLKKNNTALIDLLA